MTSKMQKINPEKFLSELLEYIMEHMPNLKKQEQINLIEKVLKNERESNSKRDIPPGANFNGHAYALGIHESEKLRKQLEDHLGRKTFIDGDMMKKLVKDEFLKKLDMPAVGCIVLYSHDNEPGQPKHSAIIIELQEDGRHIVESKFGTIEAIFTHRIDEIPLSYGDRVEFFKKPS